MEVVEEETIYLSLHRHHQNDSCVKMGSDESHFNVSLIVGDKVTRQCPQTTALRPYLHKYFCLLHGPTVLLLTYCYI